MCHHQHHHHHQQQQEEEEREEEQEEEEEEGRNCLSAARSLKTAYRRQRHTFSDGKWVSGK